MIVAIASEGREMTSEMAGVFGRCPVFLFVDTETETVDARANPALDAAGGAGVEAARFVVDQGTRVVITPKVGPKAQTVLDAAGLRIHTQVGGTAGAALEGFREKEAS